MEEANSGNSLHELEENDNEEASKLLECFTNALFFKCDMHRLESFIFPGSLILSATDNCKWTVLHFICESNFKVIHILEDLIDLGVNIDAQNSNGYTPLHTAVSYKTDSRSVIDYKVQVIQTLLERGANPDLKNNNGLTPIQLALYSNKLHAAEAFLKKADQLPNIHEVDYSTRLRHLVNCLLKERNSWSVSDTNYSIILHFLAPSNDEELFEYVAKNTKFDANALNPKGVTLLHVVAEFGSPQNIKALIDVGADPDAFCKDARTPIFHAISRNRTENIQYLLDRGASLNIIQKYPDAENSPLHYAIRSKKFEIVKILVQNGADVNELVHNWSALTVALDINDLTIAQFLLDNGADVDKKNEFGKSILDESCESAKFEFVKLLLSSGAKLNQGGVSTLHYAARGGNVDIVRLLLVQGADVHLRCESEKTNHLIFSIPRTAFDYVIMYAPDNSIDMDILETMIMYKADVNLADPIRGDTPLHLACLSNRNNDYRRRSMSMKAAVIKRLLKCNANVNALDHRGLTPFEHALYNYTLRTSRHGIIDSDDFVDLKSELKVLVAHIAKMIIRKELVVEAVLKLLKERPIVPIYEKCVKEMNRMKKNICESMNISFLSILTRDINSLGRALTNKDISQVLDGGQYKKEFPIYADDLERHIWKAKLRHLVVELGTKLFDKHVHRDFVDEFREICKYLSVEDLNNFMKACSVQLCENRFFFSNPKKVNPATMQILIARFTRQIDRI